MVAQAIFYLLAILTVSSAAIVAFSRNVVHSAFALLGTLVGVAGIYALLAADFLWVIQLLLYVGGILVLTLFAVMLTQGIADVSISNRAVGRAPALIISTIAAAIMIFAVFKTPWHESARVIVNPTTYGIGNAFLGTYALPFELASIVLLAALIGAVVISRPVDRRTQSMAKGE